MRSKGVMGGLALAAMLAGHEIHRSEAEGDSTAWDEGMAQRAFSSWMNSPSFSAGTSDTFFAPTLTRQSLTSRVRPEATRGLATANASWTVY